MYYGGLADKADTSASLRLFFALWPPPEACRRLTELASSVAAAAGARPVHPADLHLTLAFIGALPAALLPLACAAGAAQDTAGALLSLDRIERWGEAAVLGCGQAAAPESLRWLADGLAAALRVRGLPVDARRFRPHVTLCRGGAQSLPAGSLATPIDWRMESFVLAQSSAGRTAPRYRILREWPLQRPVPGGRR